jgi:hypothetical protein
MVGAWRANDTFVVLLGVTIMDTVYSKLLSYIIIIHPL